MSHLHSDIISAVYQRKFEGRGLILHLLFSYRQLSNSIFKQSAINILLREIYNFTHFDIKETIVATPCFLRQNKRKTLQTHTFFA